MSASAAAGAPAACGEPEQEKSLEAGDDQQEQQLADQLAAMGLPSTFGGGVSKRRSGGQRHRAPAATKAAAATPAAAESPALARPLCPSDGEETHWYYLDLQGEQQGPFALRQMREWHAAGYFPPGTQAWRAADETASDAGELAERAEFAFLKPLETDSPVDGAAAASPPAGTDDHRSAATAAGAMVQQRQQQRRRRQQQQQQQQPSVMEKYWDQRYRLFSLYDHGIQMDTEGWYSVTPERIAMHIAKRCACDVVIDGFAGCGGNTIAFARTCAHVIAIDNNRARLEMARHNAGIYDVAHKIEFIHGDFCALAPTLKADVVFLSPPWGGPAYADAEVFDVKTMMQPDGEWLFQLAKSITPSVAYFLPRNVDKSQASLLAGPGQLCELERNKVNKKIKSITAYYGGLVRSTGSDG